VQSERTLSLMAFGREMLTQSPSYTGLLSNSLDTRMTPRAGDQAGIQQASFPMCRKLGIQGEKCLPLLGVPGRVTECLSFHQATAYRRVWDTQPTSPSNFSLAQPEGPFPICKSRPVWLGGLRGIC